MAKIEDVSNLHGALLKKNEEFVNKFLHLDNKDVHLMNRVTSLSNKNYAMTNMVPELKTQMSNLKSKVCFRVLVILNKFF